MDTVYKILENVEVKKIGERQYEFTASTADMDRDGEVIDVEGWDLKNFKKNPVIMYAHDYRTLPIGKATHIGVKDGKLKNTVEFPPEGTYEFADIVERLVNTGYLKTESVGFIPRKWEDGEGGDKAPRRTYTKQELLEISIVPVPSNPNALMNAVKEGVITTKQFKAITEKNLIDDIVNAPIIDLTEDNPQPKEVSQKEIIDEIDYLITLIDKGDFNDDVKNSLHDLAKHLPEEIKQPSMAGMKKMMTMMADCEEMSGKAKEMAQGMMDDMKSVKPGNDIPVIIAHVPEAQRELPSPEKTGVAFEEIREAIKRLSKMEE